MTPRLRGSLEEGPPCPFLPALLSETIKHRQQSDYFQPAGGDAAFSWTCPVHGLRQKVLTSSGTGRVVSISPSFSPIAEGSELSTCPHDGPRGLVGRWLCKGRRSLAGLSFSWEGCLSPHGLPSEAQASCSALLGT